MAAASSPHGTPSEAAVDLMAEGTRVVMAPGKRWQGVGTINRMHDNGMRSGLACTTSPATQVPLACSCWHLCRHDVCCQMGLREAGSFAVARRPHREKGASSRS